MSSRARLALAAGVLLAACSGAGGGGSKASRLDVIPSATVVVAGATTVTLTAVVSGDVDVVGWTLDGPGTLSAHQGLTTIYTPPDRVDADTPVTVTAHMNALSRSVALTVKPAPAAPVVGRVLRQSGEPIENATVLIFPDLATTTDVAGTFTIPGVMAPYDVAVRAPGSFLLVVRQLRRRDPTLLVDTNGIESPPEGRVARVSGQVSGGAGFSPQPAGYRTAVAIGTPALDGWYLRQGGTSTPGSGWADDAGAYVASVPLTAAEADATLVALQWRTDGDGLPVEYVASAVRATHLVGGAGLDGQHLTLAMTPEATTTLSGTITFAGPKVQLRATARLGAARVPIVAGAWPGTDVEVPAGPLSLGAPRAADAVELAVSSGFPAGSLPSAYNLGAFRVVAPGAREVALSVPAPPNPDQPPDGATLVAATLFRWQAMAAAAPVYVLYLEGGNGAQSYALRLVTTATGVYLPDLSPLGVSIPMGGTFSWFVYGTTAASSADGACGPEGYLLRSDDFAWGRSVQRTFHTPP